jgi:hypothetical protein
MTITRTAEELLEPLRREFEESGMSEEALAQFLKEVRDEWRRGKPAPQRHGGVRCQADFDPLETGGRASTVLEQGGVDAEIAGEDPDLFRAERARTMDEP